MCQPDTIHIEKMYQIKLVCITHNSVNTCVLIDLGSLQVSSILTVNMCESVFLGTFFLFINSIYLMLFNVNTFKLNF